MRSFLPFYVPALDTRLLLPPLGGICGGLHPKRLHQAVPLQRYAEEIERLRQGVLKKIPR